VIETVFLVKMIHGFNTILDKPFDLGKFNITRS
jgi:hypothetical protein